MSSNGHTHTFILFSPLWTDMQSVHYCLFLLYSSFSRSDLVNPVQQCCSYAILIISYRPSYLQIADAADIVWLLISDKLESPLLETNMHTELGSRHTFGYPGYRDEPPDLWFSGTLLPDHTFSYQLPSLGLSPMEEQASSPRYNKH